jgi:hypothetical protein
MAAIDTIEVLDNLQFEHLNTADIYSVNAAGFAGQAVESIAIPIDAEKMSGLRVIVNNNYGASGSTIVARVQATGLSGLEPSEVSTKFQNQQPLEWTSVAIGLAVPSVELDLSLVRSCSLDLFCALVGTTAHLGTEFLVQKRSEATNNEWAKLFSFIMCAGKTAFKMDVKSTAAANQKVIPVDNPTAGLLNKLMKNIFILDAAIANCEIAYQTGCGADT